MIKSYKDFIGEETQKADKLVKERSSLLVFRKIQGKTIMQYHFMPNKLGENARQCQLFLMHIQIAL